MGYRRVRSRIASIGVVVTFGAALVVGSPLPAHAASAIALGDAIEANAGLVTGAELVATPTDSATAVMTTPYAGMPRSGDSYAVISTGDAADIALPDDSESTGTNLGGEPLRGDSDFDVTVLRLDFVAPAGTNCLLGIDFKFLSEEYPEWVGSGYNDAFIVEVDESTWTTSGSVIDAPRNIAFDPSGNEISVNAAGVTSVRPEHADGTTFDGATPLLRAAAPIAPGPHSLFLSLFDQGDHVLDSAVIVDNLRVGTVADTAKDCHTGAVVVDPPKSLRYVAIGDSFSSGEGTYIYDDDGKSCHRGPLAWPRELAAFGLSSTLLVMRAHTACTGAKTQQLFEEFKGGVQVTPSKPDPDVELVTVTIGGNDVGFAALIRNCYANPAGCLRPGHLLDFQRDVDRLRTKLLNIVYPSLRLAYPNAVIVHVGYPEIAPEPGTAPVNCSWLSSREQHEIAEAALYLNNTLIVAASKSTYGIHFVSVLDALDGHELCTKDSWVQPIRPAGGTERGHPNIEGNEAIAKAVADPIQALVS